jgi:uncharacterized membrane protein
MVSVVALVALGVLVVAVVWVGVRKPADAPRVVRWTALGLLVAEAVVLVPYTVADSGGAASYLLGVPVLAALVAVIAGHVVPAADLVAAIGVTVWGLLLMLGLGVVFLPAGVLLFLGFALNVSRRRASVSSP